MRSLRFGLIGDHDPDVTAHRAIPLAFDLAATTLDLPLEAEWLPTERIDSTGCLADFDGLWCVPASPYRNTDGALLAIRHARETGAPFLGTCGGFQHALLEYARSVLGWSDVAHAELDPEGTRLVIQPLACALVEAVGPVRFVADSRLARAYGALEAEEGYRCRFGLNPAFREELTDGPLRITATDDQGDARGIELEGHPFFVATLFQPERAALTGRLPPVVRAFVEAAAERRG
ncbi:CTP synthase C-terminal region-related (seleno)protein [Pseudomonas indica]|uniref:CTP synthase C-terminal region-related (seleno)protein n=1 Tax=Pseudomonas indica TaxID=137658 RepID=UPI0023FA1010|nr:CTP synthase [Pseudomonas indica]MBU3056300.1 CTP synthase [Pseudomonas indica]